MVVNLTAPAVLARALDAAVAGVPGNCREPVIEVELGEAAPIPERLEILAVEIVREVHHPFASIVEFQPDLVIPEVTRIDDVTLHLLVSGQIGLLLAS